MHGTFSKVFKKWGHFVGRFPCIVLVINLIILVYLSKAALNPEKVEDERTVWTPIGNQSLKD